MNRNLTILLTLGTLVLFTATAQAGVKKIKSIKETEREGVCKVNMSIGETDITKTMSCKKAQKLATQQAKQNQTSQESSQECKEGSDVVADVAGEVLGFGAEETTEEVSDVACQ